ncbi:hypothetical protein MTR_4g077580 [Medicago truncatula]|uniref:Uncharacterized protein n=1 Tax=Medicago truncatula TaxID=3880 RepID=G7JRR1_MEDTR|nr:hypothetical protein MTR_4g077580 [Medicago truncatula]
MGLFWTFQSNIGVSSNFLPVERGKFFKVDPNKIFLSLAFLVSPKQKKVFLSLIFLSSPLSFLRNKHTLRACLF